MALLNGAALILAPRNELLPGPELIKTLSQQAVTLILVPPSVLAALPFVPLPALTCIVVGGEACTEELVRR